MTRVRSAVDIPIAAAIWGAVIIGTAALFVAPPPARLLAVAVLVPVVGFLLWIYWATYYELRPDHLYCRSGPFVERIPYDRIKSATLRSNLFSSMALSTRRIEIRQHGRGFVTGTTYISPVDREAFLSDCSGGAIILRAARHCMSMPLTPKRQERRSWPPERL